MVGLGLVDLGTKKVLSFANKNPLGFKQDESAFYFKKMLQPAAHKIYDDLAKYCKEKYIKSTYYTLEYDKEHNLYVTHYNPKLKSK